MRDSQNGKTRFVAVLLASLPLLLMTFAQAASAAGVPAPQPGPPVSPVVGPLAGPFSMFQPGALAGAVVVAIAVFVAIIGSRRAAARRSAGGTGASLTALPESRHGRQHEPRARRRAA